MQVSKCAETVDYYDRHADRFIRDTLHADMSAVIYRFAKHLPKGGTVLDAGCGSGRDTKTFLDLGYTVTAFDASPAMVKHANQFTGQNVHLMEFQDMNWDSRFDSIWSVKERFFRRARAFVSGG